MTKLCPRGKAAAKRKFKVYPSAYANAYASKICAGKIKDPSGVKRKDFRGSKAEGGLMEATSRLKRQGLKRGGGVDIEKAKEFRKNKKTPIRTFLKNTMEGKYMNKNSNTGLKNPRLRVKKMGGGMMRPMYRKGGGVCLRGMNREAVGKNS